MNTGSASRTTNRVKQLLGGCVLASLLGIASAAEGPTEEDLKKATAVAIGNIAWESVVPKDVNRTPTGTTWVAETWGTGVWNCRVRPDGKFPYCERQARP